MKKATKSPVRFAVCVNNKGYEASLETGKLYRVVADPDYPDIDVRVDLHDDAIVELRRVLEEFKRYEVFYRDRGRDPSTAVTQDEFVARLEGRA